MKLITSLNKKISFFKISNAIKNIADKIKIDDIIIFDMTYYF